MDTGPLDLGPGELAAAWDGLTRAVSQNRDALTTAGVSGAGTAAEVVAGVFLALVTVFFLLKDGPTISRWLLGFVPAGNRDKARLAGERAVGTLGGYARGTALIALVDAVAIGGALLVLGVPLALPLAVVVFLGAFVPLVGATVAGALCALVALVTNGVTTALIVAAVVVVVNQVEGDVLAPIVFGRALSLHPLVILFALAGGTVLADLAPAARSAPGGGGAGRDRPARAWTGRLRCPAALSTRWKMRTRTRACRSRRSRSRSRSRSWPFPPPWPWCRCCSFRPDRASAGWASARCWPP